MNTIKSIFTKLYKIVSTFSVIVAMAFSFYCGMYIVSATHSPEDAGKKMMASIETALKDTSDQPIIMIVPEPSMIERVKADFGIKMPERKVITIKTTAPTKNLKFNPPQQPQQASMLQTTFEFWGDAGKKAGKGIANGWGWFSDKVTFIK